MLAKFNDDWTLWVPTKLDVFVRNNDTKWVTLMAIAETDYWCTDDQRILDYNAWRIDQRENELKGTVLVGDMPATDALVADRRLLR